MTTPLPVTSRLNQVNQDNETASRKLPVMLNESLMGSA